MILLTEYLGHWTSVKLVNFISNLTFFCRHGNVDQIVMATVNTHGDYPCQILRMMNKVITYKKIGLKWHITNLLHKLLAKIFQMVSQNHKHYRNVFFQFVVNNWQWFIECQVELIVCIITSCRPLLWVCTIPVGRCITLINW